MRSDDKLPCTKESRRHCAVMHHWSAVRSCRNRVMHLESLRASRRGGSLRAEESPSERSPTDKDALRHGEAVHNNFAQIGDGGCSSLLRARSLYLIDNGGCGAQIMIISTLHCAAALNSLSAKFREDPEGRCLRRRGGHHLFLTPNYPRVSKPSNMRRLVNYYFVFSPRGKEPKDEIQIFTWTNETLLKLTDLVKEVAPEARRDVILS
ncbi:unnamed protein product [Fraxinus pennsylvanica]|uniref:Uncharacterized protein n=1 Tax=Fraxinus pennsylvanica TaxID=56036 RepID=A0AAD2DT45_9LAMI|nr:unnamed protein product [Fraxinus pennsylvanica]